MRLNLNGRRGGLVTCCVPGVADPHWRPKATMQAGLLEKSGIQVYRTVVRTGGAIIRL